MSNAPLARLRPVLGLFTATTLVVGGVIGSGIFMKPSQIARATQGQLGLILALWLVCGLVNLCGALAMAELSAMLPQAGGTYIFLREAYGRLWGFLWGWAEFWVIRTGATAALAVASAESLRHLLRGHGWPADPWVDAVSVKALAVGSVVGLAAVNVIGTRWAGAVQDLTTLVKAGFVALVAALPFLLVHREPVAVSWWPSGWNSSLTVGLGSALAGIMWAYDGWGNVTVVAEEIRNPQRNVPLALAGGVLLLIALYLGANLAYHLTLPAQQIAASQIPAADVAEKLLPGFGSQLTLSILLVSAFGALNSNVLFGPRVLLAVARDTPLVPAWRRIDPRTGTPAIAIVSLSAWACLLILVGDLSPIEDRPLFDVLTNYAVFGGSLFYFAAVAAVFVLRRTQPGAERPYRCWGYPLTPLIFISFYIYLLGSMFLAAMLECAIGVAFISSGLIAYACWRRHEVRTWT